MAAPVSKFSSARQLRLSKIYSRFRSHASKANMMWWALWCAVVVAAGSGVVAAPAPDSLSPLDMVQMDSSAPDDESLYAMSPIAARYSAGAPWLYLLADMPRDSQTGSGRVKRRMPSLSIDQPMSVLRQKLSQEKERRQQILRAAANRNFLNDIGKRGFQWAPSVQARLVEPADLHEGRVRPKRKMPSLSINNPMEVLRQRLILEVARKQMREANQRQAVVNRLFLQNVGKRGFWANSAPTRYDN
ncbi:hypothetical protein PYW08_014068 [Mythimna loreyi]|uniref:Uncharacterized protein n=1 Tax=Mythimna loreyi TaxID=667449 RepID=A0ACC2R6W2_9NEOP|nr:hypothetical protein PYW08_014068 [Mythimna loreyi]